MKPGFSPMLESIFSFHHLAVDAAFLVVLLLAAYHVVLAADISPLQIGNRFDYYLQ